MIEHVYRRAAASGAVSQVIVATDDLRIATAVQQFGGEVGVTGQPPVGARHVHP